MKQETKIRATCLLLAAAALPLAPALAQDTQTSQPPPATEPAPPPAAQAPAPEPAPPPAQPAATPLPEVTTAPAPAEAPAARATTARATTTRTSTARTVVRTPTVRVPVRSAPVVATAAPVAAATAPAATEAPAPAPEVAPTAPPVPIAAEPAAGVDTVAPAPAPQPNRLTALWPWLLLGALAVAGLLVFALRRRRRAAVYDDVYETEPATRVAAEPEVVAAPAAVAADVGEPEIELGMQPVRAGVSGDDARVEFRLTVGNRGSAPAEDVRVSTWMLAAGSTEMERSLIEPRADSADTPPVTIAAGESRTMEAAVALPTSEVEGDAVLPVVVADAAWRGPDGAEHHTRRSYAVGVPDGEELAHFDTENPSGLHEGVVAQPLGEPEHA
jgi:hypothetical protein